MEVGLVLGLFYILSMKRLFTRGPPTSVLERLLSLVKIALIIAKWVFFKTLSGSIYNSFMIKGGGQGVLKRKNY